MTSFRIDHLPTNEEELYWLVRLMWGVSIPNQAICPDHISPMKAFSDAFFRRNSLEPLSDVQSIALWHGSRGLSGKSFALSILGLTITTLLGGDVNLLGGSLAQSTNIHEHMRAALEYENAPTYMVAENKATELKLYNRARVRPLTASQRTVRGPHPATLLLDEIDEMELAILDAALGQPMPQLTYRGERLLPYTVMCSTWQNPEGTFTEIMHRAETRHIPIYRWCIAQDSLVVTARGEVPIQEVTDSDLVLTREGWRHVQHVTFMGYKPTISLDLGDRQLRCTPDHLIATPDGWRPAQALAADAMSTTRPNPRVLGCEFMPLRAMASPALIPPSPRLVLVEAHQIEMLDVYAGSIATQVVDRKPIADRADHHLPYPPMGGDGAVTPLDLLQAVPVSFTARPVDAASGEHGDTVVPVWDIGVEGAHEFIANGIVVHNCYKETSAVPSGWLTPGDIEEKRQSIPAEMFRVEYDLGEPSIGNRAFTTTLVDQAFTDEFEPIFKKEDVFHQEYTFERYTNGGIYVAGADWAKEQDFTVIWVARVDCYPRRLVHYVRINRQPYPVIIRRFNDAMKTYNIQHNGAWHDDTGLGHVVNDYLDIRARPFQMTGDKRAIMLSDYINAIEKGAWKLPKAVAKAYEEMKWCRVGDIYKTSGDYHLPDTVCAGALAEYAARRVAPMAIPEVPKRSDAPPTKLELEFTPEEKEPEKRQVTDPPTSRIDDPFYFDMIVR